MAVGRRVAGPADVLARDGVPLAQRRRAAEERQPVYADDIHARKRFATNPLTATHASMADQAITYRLHGRVVKGVVKGVGHLGHDEAMEAGGRKFSLHGRVV